MKRLLLSLGLVGIVFAGHAPSAIQTQQNFSDVAKQIPAPRAVALASDRTRAAESVWGQSNLQRLGVQPIALRSTDNHAQWAGLPEASVEEIFAQVLPRTASRSTEASDENAMWVVVIRGAWLHSGPSVAAPIVGHQSPGTELHLVDSARGWFEVFDPATNERGWVYGKYYVESIDHPGKKRVAAVEATQVPVANAAPEPAAPTKQVRRVLQQPQFLAPPQVQAEIAQPSPRRRDDSVASLLERALQR
ncbi:MAG: SH3 domain-containing protein [Methyloceanibacter sp.]|jgi:hypothetical protein